MVIRSLKLHAGSASIAGLKDCNQDYVGFSVPAEPTLTTKGALFVLADGISTSQVAHLASESAVSNLLTDYYATSEAISVKTALTQVVASINGALLAQGLRSEVKYERERGYICTLASLVIKGHMAHVCHMGDSRVYRFRQKELVCLTKDHRHRVSQSKQYLLDRALGIDLSMVPEITSSVAEWGDLFLICSDGLTEGLSDKAISDWLQACAEAENFVPTDESALRLCQTAMDHGSKDNISLILVQIDQLPEIPEQHIHADLIELPPAPLLKDGENIDGLRIIKALHHSARSHAYLAVDESTNQKVVVKVPSMELRKDCRLLIHMVFEEWIAKRLDSHHLLKPIKTPQPRSHLYVAMEYIEGQTLAQWMRDNPSPDIETVRNIVEQIGQGLQAMHRRETIHQDLRPANIMITREGKVTIIDFGAAQVTGLVEATPIDREFPILGTQQYSAPEYFLGYMGRPNSDLYSLAVITYEMISGKLPYGVEMAKTKTLSQQRKLTYESLINPNREIPVWFDACLEKALLIDPNYRYQEISEFLYDLRHPNAHLIRNKTSLLEKNPLVFWKGLSLLLAVALVLAIYIGKA